MHFRTIFAENDRSGHKIKKCSQIENSVLKIQNKNRWNSNGFMAEGTGLEPDFCDGWNRWKYWATAIGKNECVQECVQKKSRGTLRFIYSKRMIETS